ncbi:MULTISPECIES: PA14 domain-containing protein [unclassified Paraflavitalea]|uniref:PA14 domain-containing protein n=1 Tax=unclassified Paraflavitalea TaxID=2798305 RepID=UPI003D3338C8
MKKTLLLLALLASAFIVASYALPKKRPDPEIVSCAPPVYQAEITTVKSGSFSDPTIWNTGLVPDGSAAINIAHSVVLDINFKTSKNIVVTGILTNRSKNIEFVGINENNFVGGGMDVLPTDIGLWVMGSGQLDFQGESKTSWCNVKGDLLVGQSVIFVDSARNWKVGDEVSISPTNANDFAPEERVISAVNGNQITLNSPLSRPHPVVLKPAKILNLTRSINVQGTVTGQSHVFIRSTKPQIIKHVGTRYMGPRKDRGGSSAKEFVSGRYSWHFHHCMKGSIGSIVEGCIARDGGSHQFVPHVSDGVSFIDDIAYKSKEIAFWWDPGEQTNGAYWNHNIVLGNTWVPGALNPNAEDAPTFSSSGFLFSRGFQNVATNNVVVASALGDVADGGGFNWEATLIEGVWVFKNNEAFNNQGAGIRIWQNSTRNHIIEDFYAANNTVGIFHGAYANSYTYRNVNLYANVFTVKAASVNSSRVRIENSVLDGGGLISHPLEFIHSPLPGEVPILVVNTTIKGGRNYAVLDNNAPEVHSVDLVHCNITGEIRLDPSAATGETIRIQPAGATLATKITKSGTTSIPTFAPSVWGNGTGLRGSYYNGSNFNSIAFQRIDNNLSFSEWPVGQGETIFDEVDYRITGNSYSMRWEGFIQPQYSEAYTFTVGSGIGVRLWINGQQVINKWSEPYKDDNWSSSPVSLLAGVKYPIKIEIFNSDQAGSANLVWSSASQKPEYVPQSQLYVDTSTVITPPVVVPPVVVPPTVPPVVTPPVVKDTIAVSPTATTSIRVISNKPYSWKLYNTKGVLRKSGTLKVGTTSISVIGYARGTVRVLIDDRLSYNVILK